MLIIPAQSYDDVKVLLNGQEIEFDVSPQIINERTMVPMRTIFEALGYTVDWSETTQSITAVKDNNTIFMRVNDTTMYYNDTLITLDVVPIITNGRTLVPVRGISEASNYDVQWDSIKRSVIIYSSNSTTEKNLDEKIISPYDDISSELNQVSADIFRGYYIEAIQECDEIMSSHKLSQEDIETLNKLKTIAKNQYHINNPEDDINKVITYDDISLNISIINSYIYRGLYLEAIQECNNTKSKYNISQRDINRIDELKYEAQIRYNEYEESVKNKEVTEDEAIQICKDACDNAGLIFYELVTITETPYDSRPEAEPESCYYIEFTGQFKGDYKKLYHMTIGKKTGYIYGGM